MSKEEEQLEAAKKILRITTLLERMDQVTDLLHQIGIVHPETGTLHLLTALHKDNVIEGFTDFHVLKNIYESKSRIDTLRDQGKLTPEAIEEESKILQGNMRQLTPTEYPEEG